MNMKIAIPTVAIVVAVLAVCFIASGSESERDGYTVKQHFEIGDYYYANTSMDGDTGYSCMTITGYDEETGLYTVDCELSYPGYDEYGSVALVTQFEIRQMTGQEVLDEVSTSADALRAILMKFSEQAGGTEITFKKAGHGKLATENYGDMQCTVYEGTYDLPRLGLSLRYLFWCGENNLAMKEEIHISDGERDHVYIMDGIDSSIIVRESSRLNEYCLDDTFEVGDYRYCMQEFADGMNPESMVITAYDGDTDEYTVESTVVAMCYDEETGEFYPETFTSVETLTADEIASMLAPTEDDMRHAAKEMADLNGADDFRFKRCGDEIVYTSGYGNMECTRYEGSFTVPELGISIRCQFWTGDDGILFKKAMVFDDDPDLTATWTVTGCSNIATVEGGTIEVGLKANLEVGDYY